MDKQEARATYYRGVREAMMQHIKITEDGLRALKGLEANAIEKLVAAVQKRHQKLLQKIDDKLNMASPNI